MKVTVSKYLNVRVGSPSLNAPCYQYLAPGSELEIDGKLYHGDPFYGNTIWYKDRGGNYYWSGGVGGLDIPNISINQSLTLRYQRISGLSGKGIKVGIIDTGIYHEHPNLSRKFEGNLFSKNIRNFSSSTNTLDTIGHGTFMSGLIGAQNIDGLGFQGLAPDCELFIAKIYNDDGSYHEQNILSALDWLLEINVDIINFSLSVDQSTYLKIKPKIEKVIQSGTICVAAAGNDHTLFEQETLYPAIHDKVISVGAISRFINRTMNEAVDFLFPDIVMQSCGYSKSNLVAESSGTSVFTALISGLIALLIEKEPNLTVDKVKSRLSEISSDYQTNTIYDSLILLKT